jgi:hypothetical protein
LRSTWYPCCMYLASTCAVNSNRCRQGQQHSDHVI